MSILVSKYFDDINIINTTADYNICNYLNNLKEKPKNILVWNLTYLKQKLQKNNLVEYVKNKHNFLLENIIFFDLFHKIAVNNYDSLKDINIYLYIVDEHMDIGLGFPKYENFINNNQLRLISCYAYNLASCNKMHNKIKYNIFFPHSVIHNIEINNNPINKILACGRGYKNISRYPYRNKIYELSKKTENINYMRAQVSYRIQNYTKTEANWGKNFIKKLNQYLIVFCDEANIETNCAYILAKFFEIMSAGSLLLTYNPHTEKFFNKLGFFKNQHYLFIDMSMSNEKILKEIDELLHEKNRKKLDKIRFAGYKKVWECHSSKSRLEYLLNILNAQEELNEYNDGINGTNYLCKKF